MQTNCQSFPTHFFSGQENPIDEKKIGGCLNIMFEDFVLDVLIFSSINLEMNTYGSKE